VDVPTSISSASCFIASLSSTASANNSTVNQLSLWTTNTGSLFIRANGATGSDTRTLSLSTFVVAYSGQRIWLEVRFTKGTSNPVVRVNGTDISFSFTASTAGTAPEWLDASLSSTNHLVGLNWPAGPAPLGQWLNAHLTDTESETWRITGRPPAWVAAGGSQNINTPENTSFEGGTVGQWSQAGNHSRSVVSDTGGLGSYALEIVATGAGSWVANAVYVTASFTRVVGQSYRVRFLAKSISGNTLLTISGNFIGTRTITTSWAEYVSDIFIPPSLGTVTIAFLLGDAGTFRVDNVRLEVLGALSLPAVQSTLVLDDVTTLGGNQARLLGMVPVTERGPVHDIQRPAESYTGGVSVSLLGGNVIGGRKRRILSITGSSSANTTISVGTSSGGTQLVNAQTVNGDFDISTFASRIVAADSQLFVTFAGTTTASVNIHLTDF
jgi:hypothetical protein